MSSAAVSDIKASNQRPHAKPFIKWAGGKSQLLNQFEPLFPSSFRTYYEPFFGGGAVFFHLRKTRPAFKGILSDSNIEVVNALRAIRDVPHELIAALKEILFKHENPATRKQLYEDVRAHTPPDETVCARAARFIYLNRTCFNGLWRVNKAGRFNVPMGRYSNPTILDAENIHLVARALEETVIFHRDFENIPIPEKGDFVYFDPPYLPASKTSDFTKYVADGFTFADHERLARYFAKLSKQGVKCMLSNAFVQAAQDLYKVELSKSDVNITVVSAKRTINSKGSKRGAVEEMVVRNYVD